MANTIITKNSATATAVPTAGQLVQGELAVNVTDKRLFTENSGGTVVELGVNPSSVTTGGLTVDANTTSDAVRITQTGTGNAFVVEDSTSPDSSPFVIDASGRVINGHTASLSVGSGGNLGTQLTGSAGASGQTMARFDNSGTGARFQFLKSRNATPGSSTTVQNGDSLGSIAWYGDDGAADYADNGGVLAAFIQAYVDGTPGTNDMPGRLVFSTTADGASSPTGRVHITSAGKVGIGTDSPDALLHVADSGAASDDFTALITAFRPNLTFGDNSSSSTDWQIFVDGDDMQFRYGDSDTGTKLANEAMRIDSAGSVGIGVSSPDSRLDVRGTLNASTSEVIATFARPDAAVKATIENGASGDNGITLGTTTGHPLALQTNDTERVRITSAGNVGIGTDSPSQLLEVRGAAARIRITDSDTSGTTGIEFVDSANTVDAEIEVGNSTQYFAIKTAGSERVRIDADGLKFNGDTDAANALDDYEEGSWTPVVADAATNGNTGTATISYALYTKIGNQVTVAATLTNIDTTGLTSSQVFYVRNLPFTSSIQQCVGSTRTDLITYQGGRTMATSNVSSNDSWITFLLSGSGANDTPIDCGDLSNGTADIAFTITYFT